MGKEKGKADSDNNKKKGSQIRKELAAVSLPLLSSSEKTVTIAAEPPSPRNKNTEPLESSTKSGKPPPQERKEGFKRRKGSFPSLTSFFQKKPNSAIAPIPVQLSKRVEEEEEYIEKPVVESHETENEEGNSGLNSSVKLRSLIKKDSELYRKTILWERMAEPNHKKIVQLESYPWHTGQNLIMLLDAKLREKLIEKQLIQIDVLGQLCDDILEPAFQQYLTEIKYEAKQAESFCNYLRQSIETTMDTNLLTGYPLLTEQLKYGHRKKVMPEEQLFTVEDKEKLDDEEVGFRAKFHLNCWQLVKAGKSKQLNIIIPYITAVIAEMASGEYVSILEQLLVATAEVNILSRKLDLNTKAIALDLEQRHPPQGYIGLSTHLSLDPVSRVEIIQKLAKFFHSERRDNLPECSSEEVDFFFAEGSSSLALVQTAIVDFMRQNIKLCKVDDGSISPRNRDSFTNRLVNELKVVLAPEQLETTPRSHCF